MKKKLLSILATGVTMFTLCACAKEKDKTPSEDSGTTPVIPKEGKYEEFSFGGQGYLDKDYFALKAHLYNLSIGETTPIALESLPTSYAANSLEFESKDESIVSVDASGKLTAKKKGVADVEIRSKDGEVSNHIRVVVSSKSNPAGVKTAVDNINAIYNAEDYKSAKRVMRYEYDKEFYSCEGVVDHGMEGYEILAYDSSAGYLYIEGPSLYYKTPGGTPEQSDGKWIMYPINGGLMTRLVHETPVSKRYMDINTAAYKGNYDAITRDITNFFFVDGESIIDNLLDTYDNKGLFQELAGISSTEFYHVDDNSVVLKYKEEHEGEEVTMKEELNSFDIPAGTKYDEVFTLEALNKNARCLGYNIGVTMDYELGGKKWQREFQRLQMFDEDFEVQKIQNPKDNGYTYVDSLYDL